MRSITILGLETVLFSLFLPSRTIITCWHYFLNDAMQRLHVAAFWLRLAVDILFDLFLYAHMISLIGFPCSVALFLR